MSKKSGTASKTLTTTLQIICHIGFLQVRDLAIALSAGPSLTIWLFDFTTTDTFGSSGVVMLWQALISSALKAENCGFFLNLLLDNNVTSEWHRLQELS